MIETLEGIETLNVYTIESDKRKEHTDYKFTYAEDTTVKYPILVYGTLKQGFFNSPILEKSDFVGQAYSRYSEYDFWSRRGVYPAIVPQGKYAVGGEVYFVNETTLQYLDIMENNYDRVCIPIKFWQKDTPPNLKFAWVYMLSPDRVASNAWTQDDQQIKVVDQKRKLKIWGGEWARKDSYIRKLWRAGQAYTYTDSSIPFR